MLYEAEEPGAIVFRQIATGHLCVHVLCEEENGTAKRYGERQIGRINALILKSSGTVGVFCIHLETKTTFSKCVWLDGGTSVGF